MIFLLATQSGTKAKSALDRRTQVGGIQPAFGMCRQFKQCCALENFVAVVTCGRGIRFRASLRHEILPDQRSHGDMVVHASVSPGSDNKQGGSSTVSLSPQFFEAVIYEV